MTPRVRRLTRLHAIRRVDLAATARRLSAATEAATVMTSVARQIEQLRAGAPPMSTGSGYALKSAAASGAALEATAARHAVRTAEAERRRLALAAEVQRDSAAADAIERVIERSADAAMPAEVLPRRRTRR